MYQRELLLLLFLLAKSLYVPLNHRTSRHYWKMPVDDRIPLLPWFVIPYVGFIPYIALSIALAWNTAYIVPFLESLSIACLTASVFWYFFPNGVKRPIVDGKDLLHRLLVYIYKNDHDTNGFPSAHVFITLICAYYLSVAHFTYSIQSWIFAVLIVLSTIFTKQHYVVDIIGGIVVFGFSVAIFL